MRFSHLIVSDRGRLKKTRVADDHTVKMTVHHQRFHALHICIRCPANSVNNDWFQDFLKNEPSPTIKIANLRIGCTRTHTDEATNAVAVHSLHNMRDAL